MHIHIVSIFPAIFDSFLSISLITKAQEKSLVSFSRYNPRDFCHDSHQQIDDTVYGGGAGMLIKAEPIIDTVNHVISGIDSDDFLIVYPSPSQETFTQIHAHSWAKCKHLIFVCGRYEGIDHRWEQYFCDRYPDKFVRISLGNFITLGGEVPSMTMIEAITRLIPGVIKERASRVDESYSIQENMKNIEHPHYTKPEEVCGYKVPDALLSGDKHKIDSWKEKHAGSLNNTSGDK